MKEQCHMQLSCVTKNKMKNKLIALLCTFITNFALIRGKLYHNYSLYDVYPTERFQMQFLRTLEDLKYIDVIFWSRPYKLNKNTQVLVNSKDETVFEERLNHFSIKRKRVVDNIQDMFNKQYVEKYLRMKIDSYTWTGYHKLEDVYQWMSDIAISNSDRVTLKTIGLSAEGREILSLEIGTNNTIPKVIVEGAIHGDEWITTEFVTYLADELIHANTSNDARLKRVATKFIWILIPVVNPDGYDYSMKYDRLWVKNRRKFYDGQIGVNLNKNFNYNFCSHGGSNKTESDQYCGPSPFSEPETQALSQTVHENRGKLSYYIAVHAYGQSIIIPYSDRIKHKDNFLEVENYGKQALLKMYKMNGDRYRVGTNYDVFGFQQSGDSISWVKNRYKVKFVFAFYLRDNGTYGYALPPEEILPTCQASMVGLLELMTARYKPLAFDLNSALILRSTFIHLLLFLVIFSFE